MWNVSVIHEWAAVVVFFVTNGALDFAATDQWKH